MTARDVDSSNRFGGDRFDDTTLAVFALTAVALLARVFLLGARVSHFDEGRVAWWTLEYARTGEFSYQYIIHGPFVQHVNAWLWTVLPPSDFASRLPVAIIGGLLPLTALLFRRHLRDVEVGTLAFFLALNPVLLYYSRFFRSSILVATFMFVAFGLLVRYYDTRRLRYVHGAVVFSALGFAAKENAVVYMLAWLGSAALVADYGLFVRRDGETGLDRLDRWWGRHRPGSDALLRYAGHASVAVILFALVTLFFYAPRTSQAGGVGLYQALGNPALLPEVWATTVEDIRVGLEYWFGHSSSPGCHKDNLIDAYICFLGRFVETLAGYAAPLFGLAVVGFALERYGAVRPRPLVMFASYWGFVSVVGYPLGTDIYGAWITVNALVPLAVPAAVGLGLVLRRGHEAYAEDDRISAGLAAVLVLLVVGQVAVVGVQSSYVDPASADNGLVQYAQPEQGWRASLDDMRALSATNDGPDVLVYGSHFVDGDDQAVRTPACIEWFNMLPLPWYMSLYESQVVCANTTSQLDQHAAARPPVVIARAEHTQELRQRFPNYEVRTYFIRSTDTETVVLVDRSRLE